MNPQKNNLFSKTSKEVTSRKYEITNCKVQSDNVKKNLNKRNI